MMGALSISSAWLLNSNYGVATSTVMLNILETIHTESARSAGPKAYKAANDKGSPESTSIFVINSSESVVSAIEASDNHRKM